MPHVQIDSNLALGYHSSVPEGQIDGSKPVLVLLHGYIGEASLFERQFSDPSLTERFTLIAIDLPGAGLSWDVPALTSLAGLPVLAQQLVRAVNLLVPDAAHVHLLGHNVGALLVELMLAHAPERFGSSVLISPVGLKKTASPSQDTNIASEFADFWDFLLEDDPEASPEKRFAVACVYSILGDRVEPEDEERMIQIGMRELHDNSDGGVERRRSFVRAVTMGNSGFGKEELQGLTHSVLVVRGTEDHTQSPEVAREHLDALSNAKTQFLELPGEPHWGLFMKGGADKFNPLLLEYLTTGSVKQ